MPGAFAAPGAGVTGGRRKPVALPPASQSAVLLIRIAPRDVGLFRFLLEARDNVALFTVLDPRMALLKLLFSPHQTAEVHAALADMAALLPFDVKTRPTLPSIKA